MTVADAYNVLEVGVRDATRRTWTLNKLVRNGDLQILLHHLDV